MIYTVTLNPALDKTMFISDFSLDKVNRPEKVRLDAGGKGINVSRIITSLGGKTKAFGILGGNSGRIILKMLLSEKIPDNFILVKGETRTNLKIVDYKNNTYTDINESGESCSNEDIEEILLELLDTVKQGDTVVFAGSPPKGADCNTYKEWIIRFKQKGARVFLDADKEALRSGIEASPYFIKPNIDELSSLIDKKLTSVDDVAAVAYDTVLKYGIERVAVTMGENGSLLADKTNVFYAKPVKVKVKSTVGAGDSFLAAYALAEENGLDTKSALKYAAAVSSAKVMCEAVKSPDKFMIEKVISEIEILKII